MFRQPRLLPPLRLSTAAIALLVLPLMACALPVAPSDAAARAPSGEAVVQPAGPDPNLLAQAATPVTLESLVKAALADAAKLSGRPRDSLVVIDAAAVEWPDGAGGCPEPGVAYTQALVPGYRIRIRAGKQLLNYHATRFSRVPQLCPADRVQQPLPARGGAV